MKHLATTIVLSLLLAGCGSSDIAAECVTDYWDGTYGTCLPEGWTVMDKETLRQRGVPDETVTAFRSDLSVSGQFPSITVTREPLQQVVTASDYSDASIRSVSVLPQYTLVDSTSVNIDDENVKMHVFTGQPVADEPARRFYQVSTVVGSDGFTVTASAPLFIDRELEKQIQLILEQSTFIGEVVEE